MQLKVKQSYSQKIDDQDDIEIDQKTLTIFKDIFHTLLAKNNETDGFKTDYAETYELLNAIRNHAHYQYFRKDIGRNKAEKFSLKNETVDQVLDRIQVDGDEFIDWEDFLEYFTKRGRPKHLHQKESQTEQERALFALPPELSTHQVRFSKKIRKQDSDSDEDNEQQQKLRIAHQQQRQKINQQRKEILRESLNKFNDDCEEEDMERDQMDLYESNLERVDQYLSKGDKYFENEDNNNKKKKKVGAPENELTYNIEQFLRKVKDVEQDSDQEQQQQELQRQQQQKKKQRKKQQQEEEFEKPEFGDDFDSDREQGRYIHSPRKSKLASSTSEKQLKQYQTQQQVKSAKKPTIKKQQKQQFNKQTKQKQWKTKELNQDSVELDDYYKDKQSKTSKNVNFTIPEPFEFESRESKRRKKQQQQNEEENKKYQFKAKEVPSHVKKPLYDELTRKNEERRQQVKQNSVQITLQKEKPFSFYNRDKDKKGPKFKHNYEPEPYEFKASSVPWFCGKDNIQVMQQMEDEKKQKQQEKIAKQTQESLSKSRLPPRLEEHQNIKKAQEMIEGKYNTEWGKTQGKTQHSFQPETHKEIPDFEKMQSTFQNLLDKKRKNKRPTQVKPFNFEQSKKVISREYMDQENQMMKQEIMQAEKIKDDPIERLKKFQSTKPAVEPASTKKWQANIDKSRKQQEEQKKEEEKKKLLEKQKEEKHKKFEKSVKEAFRNTQKSKPDTKEENKKNQEDLFKERDKGYKEQLDEMYQKVSQRPLLFEQSFKRDDQIQKMKKVAKYVDILEQTGVKNYKKMLTKEELELYEDYQHFKKKGYIKD